MTTNDMIDGREAQRLAGRNDLTLRRWRRLGLIPQPKKILNKLYWDRREFTDALDRIWKGEAA